MNQKIQLRNVDIAPPLKSLIERHSHKVKKVLPTFPADSVDLHVTLERLPRKNQFRAALVLTLPQNAIRVEDTRDNLTTSVVHAFEELFRKIKKFKSNLNREKFWHRQGVIAEKRGGPGPTFVSRDAINRNLQKIENYIRRELLHHSMVEGLPAGLVEPDAVVDEVFVEVASGLDRRPENLALEQWMFQVTRQKLSQRLAAIEEARQEQHVEETPRFSSRWDDEVLNFYHPDEVLRLEDVLADQKIATPEDSMARRELAEQLNKEIARLPKAVRDSFVLYALEGFAADEVAMITGTDPAEVLKHVETARKRLRSQLPA